MAKGPCAAEGGRVENYASGVSVGSRHTPAVGSCWRGEQESLQEAPKESAADPLDAHALGLGLQGRGERERSQDIFAVPVGELSEALQILRGQAVRLLKAAHGLASAPREWFLDVAAVLEQRCHMERTEEMRDAGL